MSHVSPPNLPGGWVPFSANTECCGKAATLVRYRFLWILLSESSHSGSLSAPRDHPIVPSSYEFGIAGDDFINPL